MYQVLVTLLMCKKHGTIHTMLSEICGVALYDGYGD